jgi:hypothetical protein
MASGKSRNSKRPSSSSTSYASTVTTVVFIAFCVLAIWMLTSTSVVPRQPTTRTSFSSTTKSNVKKDIPVFEDNPGDLPLDAIKSDDDANDNSKPQLQDQKSESLTENSKDLVVENEKQGSLQLRLPGKESAEEQEKQKESENQISEESSLITQNQQQATETEQTSNEESEENQKVEEGNKNVSKTSENSQESDNQKQVGVSKENENLVDGEQEQRLQQQLREDQSRENTQETQNAEEQHVESNEENSETSKQEFQDVTRDGHQQSQVPAAEDQENRSNEAKEEIRNNTEANATESNSGEAFPGGTNAVIPKESNESKKSWSTQAAQSENEKERRKDQSNANDSIYGYTWQMCNVTAGPDYIPCLDNEKALRHLRTTRHFEHRERHCPEEGPTCLVPYPDGYRRPIEWPKSRDKVGPARVMVMD